MRVHNDDGDSDDNGDYDDTIDTDDDDDDYIHSMTCSITCDVCVFVPHIQHV